MDETRKLELMAYCHLDDLSKEDELLLESFFYGAEEYLRGADVPEPKDTGKKAIYDLVVNAMVNDAWDNRRSTVTGQLFENPVWNRMKNQLKFSARAEAAES